MRLLFRSLCCSLLVLVAGSRVLADGDHPIALADTLFRQGSYHDAVTEYKRFAFFHAGDLQRGLCFQKMGVAFSRNGDWAGATDSFRAALSILSADSLRNDTRTELAITLIASGNHAAARYQLLKLIHLSESDRRRRRALFFQGVNDVYLFDWNSAFSSLQAFFCDCTSPQCSTLSSEILPSLRKLMNQEYKSPRKAKVLSTVLPGLGQAYAGHYGRAINALALNGLTAGAVVYSVRQGNHFDALVFVSLFMRFFWGNRESAEKLAESYNLNLNRTNARCVLDKLAEHIED